MTNFDFYNVDFLDLGNIAAVNGKTMVCQKSRDHGMIISPLDVMRASI